MNYTNQINRLIKEIADLRKAEAKETKKEADIHAGINRANQAASRANSASTLQNELKKIERSTAELANVQKKRAEISGKIAAKSKDLSSNQECQAREDEKERKRISDEQKRLIREREDHERKITSQIGRRAETSRITTTSTEPDQLRLLYLARKRRQGYLCSRIGRSTSGQGSKRMVRRIYSEGGRQLAKRD